MGFPQQVNTVQALAVAGDFCDVSPRATVDAGPGGLVAGPDGLTVGRFAWVQDADNRIANNHGSGAPTGFVHREQQALITEFLAESSNLIPRGFHVTLFNEGGFWAKNDGAAAVTKGMKAYANNATGQVSFAATGAPTAGGSGSASTVAANVTTASCTLALNSMTASIAGTTLTVTAIAAGTVLGAGQILSGGSASAGYVDPATTIVEQLTGTAGSTGTYRVSVSQAVASTTIAATGGGMTVGAMASGTLSVGQVISGTGIVTGTKILGRGTGTGGAGTYTLDTAPTPGATITVTGEGGTLTVGGTVAGTFSIGDVIAGANVTTGSTITSNASTAGSGMTGTGGAGTYGVTVGDTATTTAITVYANTETKWIAQSAAAVGELVKMSSHLLG